LRSGGSRGKNSKILLDKIGPFQLGEDPQLISGMEKLGVLENGQKVGVKI
jgi:hypothetical protein